MEKTFINPPELAAPRGYTHVVTVTGGKAVFIAGQVAWDAEGEVVGKGDLRAQATQAYTNLKAALAAAGATTADVVKMNTYVVNFKSADLPVIREVRGQFFPQANMPASTLVGVQALAVDGLLIEVEAVAVVRE
ncbi:MAG TPA: RidA family protein [Candidatus Binatia bacterium]|nr:RidA family protein [Candidatus Binatia bacterium]